MLNPNVFFFSPGNDNLYYDLAQNLRQRITEMKVRIDTQQKTLAALRDRVKDQVAEMLKIEVSGETIIWLKYLKNPFFSGPFFCSHLANSHS